MGRRNTTSLRDFQARLTERLKLAASQRTSSAHLGVEIANQRYLVELADAGEIVPIPGLTSVPLTQDWFRGVANLRGMLYSVTDFARFIGQGITSVDRDSRLLAMGSKLNFNASIIVTRMLGLKNVGQMECVENAVENSVIGASYKDSSGYVWKELKLSLLANDERFLLVGR